MPAATETAEHTSQTINVVKDIFIGAPIDVAFEATLEEMGPAGEMPDGKPFPMKLEAWPGGRWFRDLGQGAGHLWGHVQVIKPPNLLEVCGPLFVSYPAMNHVQYRLTAEGEGTRLKITHRGVALVPAGFLTGVDQGWEYGLKRIRDIAEGKKGQRRKGAGR